MFEIYQLEILLESIYPRVIYLQSLIRFAKSWTLQILHLNSSYIPARSLKKLGRDVVPQVNMFRDNLYLIHNGICTGNSVLVHTFEQVPASSFVRASDYESQGCRFESTIVGKNFSFCILFL